MRKTTISIEELDELHRRGDLEQAQKGYLELLNQEPQNVDALHALALIAVERKELSEAVDYLNTAMHYQPNNPTLVLHLANVLKMQGLFARATALLLTAVAQFPTYAPAFNNLGTLYYAQGKLEEAIHYYKTALEIEPHYVDAYYNLGLALGKREQWKEAAEAYEALLKEDPEHTAAKFQLACTFMQEKKWDQALSLFLEIEKTHPHHLETQINFATCYLRKGALDEAKLHYLKALALKPDDSQTLYNLGYISSSQGKMEEAIQHYQQMLALNAEDFSAHNNLGAIFLYQQRIHLALQHYEQALRLQPNNAYIHHLIKILKKDQEVLTSPPEYLRSLFNFYADHYDAHLLKVLDYQVPQLLLQAVLKTGVLSEKKADILDLGCGTGLCAAFFKPYAAHLTGVDLASQMLAVAAEKKLYDTLIEEDYLDFLKQKKAAYDWIIAGDVLVYRGDLKPVFPAIKEALREDGLFAFNAEISEKEDFALDPSGRFIHHKGYLDRLILQNNLAIVYYAIEATRLQNQLPVYSHLYVVQNKPILRAPLKTGRN